MSGMWYYGLWYTSCESVPVRNTSHNGYWFGFWKILMETICLGLMWVIIGIKKGCWWYLSVMELKDINMLVQLVVMDLINGN